MSAAGVFREATHVRTKSCQDELIKYSKRYPGRLACSNMQTWNEASVAGGTSMVYQKTSMPPAAKTYVLAVVQPGMGNDRNNRNLREIETLAYIADHLAKNQIALAADIVTQRMMACRLAEEEKGWHNAQYVELVPVDSLNMIPKPMRQMARREGEAETRIQKANIPERVWQDPNDWAKGKGKGKGKGKKGKKQGWYPKEEGQKKGWCQK